MIICLAAALLGAFIAIWATIFQFALGLVFLALVGASVAMTTGTSAAQVWTWTGLLYVCTQVGYACGLAAVALLKRQRRRFASDRAQTQVRKPFME